MQLTNNFAREEFSCNDQARTPVPVQYSINVQQLANNLQVLRDALGEPVHVLSGYRTPAYNRAVGGVAHSQHLVAKAADLHVDSLTPVELYHHIELQISLGKMRQGGLGLYPTFVHYDVRGYEARW